MKRYKSMIRKVIFLTILIFHVIYGMGQSFILKGKVTDGEMKALPFATVAVPKQGKITMTSINGEFQLTLMTEDSVVVKFSTVGYKTKTRVLRNPKDKQTLQVVLYSDNTLAEVQVQGQKIETGQVRDLKAKDLKTIPSASGNAVEILIQTQAGVTSHDELSSQYNVRGGNFNENSVYIEGIEIFRPFLVRSGQQEGLSIINPYMVDKIAFSAGGFTAKYGDKMSSVLDINYKRLSPGALEGTVSASMLGGSAYLGMATKKISWLNSVRYKTSRYLLGTLETNGEYRPSYLDYQTYLSYQPSKNWEINILGNISDNHYNFEPEDRETAFGTIDNVKKFKVYFDGHEKDRFTTYFGSIGISGILGSKTKVTLLGSAYYTHEQEKYDIQGQYWLNQTETSENLAVGTYFEHSRNYLKANVRSLLLKMTHKTQKHAFEAGLQFKQEHIEEQSTEYEMRDSAGYSIPHTGKDLKMIYSMKANNALDANRVEAYLQNTYRFTSAGGHSLFTLNYGVRISHWNFNRETIMSPRISLGVIPAYSENTTLRFATGIYYQAPFYKELRDTNTVDGTNYATLNRNIKSQRSIHFILGYDYRFHIKSRRYKLTAEAYYKALSNLIPYSVNNMKVIYYGDNVSSGHTAGVEVGVYGEFVPGTDSWLNVSLMNTSMKLNGKSIPLPSDCRYALNLYFTDYFPGSDRWKMSLRLAFSDGLPFFAPHQELDRYAFRASAYRRADIGLNYCLWDRVKAERSSFLKDVWLGMECLNVLGINNVNSYYWITDVTQQQYAVPNYLTGRQINVTARFDF